MSGKLFKSQEERIGRVESPQGSPWFAVILPSLYIVRVSFTVPGNAWILNLLLLPGHFIMFFLGKVIAEFVFIVMDVLGIR